LRMRRYRLRKKEEKEEQEKLRSGDRRRWGKVKGILED
jgi:hypothetical protein